MPAADVHRPLRVVGVVLDGLDEQRHRLTFVGDREQRVADCVQRDIAGRRARHTVWRPWVGAVSLEPVDERAALHRVRRVLRRDHTVRRLLGRLTRLARRRRASLCRLRGRAARWRRRTSTLPVVALVTLSSSSLHATATSAITETAASTRVLPLFRCTIPPLRRREPPDPPDRGWGQRLHRATLSRGCCPRPHPPCTLVHRHRLT